MVNHSFVTLIGEALSGIDGCSVNLPDIEIMRYMTIR